MESCIRNSCPCSVTCRLVTGSRPCPPQLPISPRLTQALELTCPVSPQPLRIEKLQFQPQSIVPAVPWTSCPYIAWQQTAPCACQSAQYSDTGRGGGATHKLRVSNPVPADCLLLSIVTRYWPGQYRTLSVPDFSNEMTQVPQREFETSWENAETWMKNVHERLKINDNTEGPRPALEARLRETEKICALEPEGKLLLDMVLMAAENHLSKSSEEEKHEIHIKLGKIKCMFEETTVYMTHCHSRIEWVWLHWNEYLKARDEFYLWVHNMKLTLEPDVELQLGLKQKRWHYEQAQVLLRDVNNQSCLLDRLLEEAASLYNRIGDPSVDETVQKEMMTEYKQIKRKAKERTSHLENILKEHEAYYSDVNKFQSWLNSVIEKLKCCVGEATESTEYRLSMLQEISKEVQSGGKELEDLERKSLEVIKNTSPLGAEEICKELEELRKALADLKRMNNDEEESLLKAHSSENAFLLLARQLEANINEFRKAIQRLEESLESGERVKSEDELLALWKTLNATKSALAAEETKGEGVKVQLKELFKFSKDVQPLSDGVIAAIREYQRAKSKAFKVSTETESALKQHFRIPLLEFQHWKRICERVLDTTSTPVSDAVLNHDCLLQIEKLLEESANIEDKLSILQTKKERISGVLGEQKAKAFLTEVASASRERDSLHVVLLERKETLLSLASQSKEFDAAFEHLRKKVSTIRIKAGKESELQPDLVGKETQLQRFEMFKDELLKLEPEFKVVASMAESSPTHKLKVSQLSSEYITLHKSLEINKRKSKTYIKDHLIFNDKLLDLQRWLMVTRQELESFQDSNGHWDVESREKEIQILLSEITEKDIQLQQVDSQGLLVMETSSAEGAAHIQNELRQLNASWVSLKLLWEALARTFKDRELQRLALLPPKITYENSINQTTDLLPDTELHWTASQSDNGSNEMNNSNDSEEFGPSGIVGRIVYDTSPQSVTLTSEKSRIPQRTNKTTSVLQENDPSSTTTESEKSSVEINTSITSDSSQSGITVRSDKSRIPTRVNQTSSPSVQLGNGSSFTPGESGRDPNIKTGLLNDTSPPNVTVRSDNSQIPRRRTQASSSAYDSSLPSNSDNDQTLLGKKQASSSSVLQVTDPLIPSADAMESSGTYSGTAYFTSPRNITVRSDDNRIAPRINQLSSNMEDPVSTSEESGKSSSTLKINTGTAYFTSPRNITVRSDDNRIAPRINQLSSNMDDPVSTSEESGKSSSTLKINTGSAYDSSLPSNSDNDQTLLGKKQASRTAYYTSPTNITVRSDDNRIAPRINQLSSNMEDPVSTSGESGKSSSTLKINTGEAALTIRRKDTSLFSIFSYSSIRKQENTFQNTRLEFQAGSPKTTVNLTSPYNIVSLKRSKKGISLAESVDFVDSSSVQSKEERQTETSGGHMNLLKEFELWLQEENSTLNKICSTKALGREEMKSRLSKLQRLQLRIPQGQRLFESLLVSMPAMAVTDNLRLEDLRYQWMLYKSKLRDAGSSSSIKTSEELRGITKKSSGGLCSFLHRVCCAALPLQLLLLLLLLLALLILLMQESQNCALSNNFARSFNLMLKYERPPPT
ncbi:nesprin-3 isoform X6 [Xenopus laevis]|uniref:Nesprin-3 isoform X6 n=1 Tax=Xenopus laevis TaxID=8355 RepID=A0A8J1LHY0_XENLA|nr:nesprin-3 isoform X6 [Xenopus laevis]